MESTNETLTSELLIKIRAAVTRVLGYCETYLNEYQICFDSSDNNIKSINTTKSNLKKIIRMFNETNAINDFKNQHGDQCIGGETYRNCSILISDHTRNIPMPSIMASLGFKK